VTAVEGPARAIRAVDLIERKRDGGELDPEELRALVLGYVRDEVPDYQMAAFCMAVVFRGMSAGETHALTDAMVASGATIDLSPLGRKVVDKHSTGGVGDKVSIALGPVVAACGVPFAKMSGRGLGHTGGTLDKLESIPGFRVELDEEAFVAQVADVGMAIVGQTVDLVPADRRLYALRDVTGTVDSIPLIASSIMSKKVAAGADAIVLDVKVGDGAFMKTPDRARDLARTMVELGRQAGREVVCELTDMDQPLGSAVGNALEIREAVATLRGEGPADVAELVLAAASHLLSLSDLGIDADEGRRRAEDAIASGHALALYKRWVQAQGGDPDEAALPVAPAVRTVPAPAGGHVQAIAATRVGLAALRLGAGRSRKEDAIDHSVGIVCLAKRGDSVEVGQPLAEVHARDETSAAEAVAEIAGCYRIGAEPPEPRPIILDVLR
jgi:pyrimidine-nucleoside phosphorylase